MGNSTEKTKGGDKDKDKPKDKTKPEKQDNKKASKQHLKICFLGDAKVGKTAIIHQLLNKEFMTQYEHTLEDLFNYNLNFFNEDINLHIFDTPGGDDRTSIRQLYLSNSRAFVIVYAVDDLKSFQSVLSICNEIKMARKEKDYAIIFCANKTDLGVNVIKQEDEDFLQSNSGIPIIRTSAKDNPSVMSAFQKLMELVYLQEI